MSPAKPYRKAVILGAAGFIGINLAETLATQGFDLVCFDRVASPHWPKSATSLVGDFSGPSAELLSHLNDAIVFHLISSCLPSSDAAVAAKAADRDMSAITHYLEETKGRKLRWVFASSGGTVYGPNDNEQIDELSPTNPICAYAVAKLAIEQTFALYGQSHNTDYVVVRPSNPYGPWQHPLRGQGIVPALLYKAIKGDTIEIWGDGTTVRDYIYITDIARGMVAAAVFGKIGEIYNIGTSLGLSINQLIELIGKNLGLSPKITYAAARSVDVKRNVLNAAKLSAHTGWKPKTMIQSGLELTASWLERNMSAWESTK